MDLVVPWLIVHPMIVHPIHISIGEMRSCTREGDLGDDACGAGAAVTLVSTDVVQRHVELA